MAAEGPMGGDPGTSVHYAARVANWKLALNATGRRGTDRRLGPASAECAESTTAAVACAPPRVSRNTSRDSNRRQVLCIALGAGADRMKRLPIVLVSSLITLAA